MQVLRLITLTDYATDASIDRSKQAVSRHQVLSNSPRNVPGLSEDTDNDQNRAAPCVVAHPGDVAAVLRAAAKRSST